MSTITCCRPLLTFFRYADPRGPYHRKAAFDLGDAGAGVTANNLELGCDCLGSIYYHSAVISDAEGKAAARDNCICVHEQVMITGVTFS